MNKVTLALAMVIGTLMSGCSVPESRIFGIIERPQIQVSSPSTSLINELLVKRGEQVSKGQILVQMDNEIQVQQVAAAQSQIKRLESALHLLQAGTREEQLQQAKARVSATQANWTEAKRQVVRQEQLIKDNLTSQNAVDSARANLDATLAAYNEAQEKLRELENGARFETVQQAQIAIEEANSQLAIAKKQLNDLTLTSPTNGVIEDLPWQSGERPPAGAPIALIADSQHAFARLYLPESKLSQITLGSSLSLNTDGNTNALQGKVTYISSSASFTPYFALSQEERARLMYVVEVELPENTDLPTGTPVWMVMP
ncbi:HlyD family efflux transporter periplasmic adaptor subunit (plasmid) [Pseudoalteromonas xiamenensis]|uniref:HlyD family secretion protein n=1 Tax=Pseudoalteromonas xiamenensis TaxID=882626 RepID=UPI0027E446A0|nr:HlyD family efflux transporter periplasmic adaptor subunit [Pseudoalteromonas xiamenensis]WMN61881.1 HlyD family efflux transporter periplasmic adaptor subunit [Pseudoalteromonas xiamenensis]